MKTIFLIFLSIICIQSVTVAQVVGSSPCLTAYPSAPSQVITVSNSVLLLANPAPAGFGYRWFDSDGVTQMGTSQSLSTPILSATKVYYLAYHHTSSTCLTAKVPVRVIWNGEKKTVVKTYSSRDSLTTEAQIRSGNSWAVSRVYQYYDSLGRSNQTVAIQASVGGLDVISFNTYDNYGRELRDYLPFANNSSSPGLYRSNAASLHSTYYTSSFGDSRGFANKTYEASPLSRLTKQGAPGTPWIGKEINLNENTNGSGDAVRIWTVDGAGLPVTASNYPSGALSKFETINENSQKTIEYKDKLGRLILKKVQETSTPAVDHTGWMCTYYVFDSFGRLRVVMPPKATAAILGGQSSTLASIRDGLYYLYTYDERGRMITKKLPDKGTEEMVYDLQDRLVAMRDAILTGQNKWHYIKYDALGRQVMTGLVPNTANTTTRQGLQNLLNTSYGANNAVINATSGKTGTTNAGGFPNATDGGEGDVMTVNYYDNYSFRKATLTYSKPNSTYHDQSTKVHGLLTGKLVRNLGNSTRYETAIYYDDQGRLIQTFEDHHLGGTMRASTKFDFENRPVETVTAFSTPGTQTITKNYHYNNAGLISSITHKINSGAAVTLAQFSYDQLGSLSNKTFPVAGNAAMNFTYNIRGWMKKINDPQVSNGTADIFAQELFYETGSQFNGNIAKVEWRGRDDVKRIYEFTYDVANRLKTANYTVPTVTSHNGRYNLGYINYDANGNITTLQRVNQQSASIWALVDNLAYSYVTNSNKLSNVHDHQTTNTYLSKDFKNLGTTAYTYNANGNLTVNSDKSITSISYNHLNLPNNITFSGTNKKIDYWYNAEGVKVRQVNTDGAIVKTIDYIGEFVFENSAISFILHEEGRAAFESSAFQYEFFITDHLGNVRQVVRAPVSALRVATMEPEKAEEEEELFENIKESRQGASEHNKTPGGYATAWLNADRGRILGPSRTQEVQEGDSVELGVFGKYVDPRKTRLHPVSFVKTGANTKMIQQLAEFGQNLRATGPNELAIANVVALVITELQQKPAPEAYMGYALYDSDSVLYEQGKIVLSKKARNKHEELIQKLAVRKDGYIETFLVNETSENVWFDQFRIMSTGPLIVQETHYDPWGVELSGLGYQYGGIKVNPYLYNGKEANGHLGVNLFDYGARMYDPAIGRWFVVDPLSNHELQIDKSPYAYGWNNPIRYRDPNGMCPNGCSEGEKTKDIYAEGAVVQNRWGASQLRDGKWVKISHTPMTGNSSDGIRINGMFGGGGNSYGSSNNEVMEAGLSFGDLLTSTELSIAALNPSFQAAASQAKHGGDVPFFLKKNIFKSPHLPNNNAVYLGKVSSSFAKSGATIMKVAAPALTVTALVTNGINIISDGKLTYGDAFVGANTLLQVVFPFYGVAYGLADVGSSIMFGQSITDYTKNIIDSNTSGSINLK